MDRPLASKAKRKALPLSGTSLLAHPTFPLPWLVHLGCVGRGGSSCQPCWLSASSRVDVGTAECCWHMLTPLYSLLCVAFTRGTKALLYALIPTPPSSA